MPSWTTRPTRWPTGCGRSSRGECIIGIRLPRTSAHLYVAQLAVLKSGAAFTCLDTSFPEERVREVLEDAEAVVLLTDRSDVVHPDDPDPIALVDLGIRAARGGEDDAGALPPYPTPASLAYVIYTSGTTGRPKGVMIEHRSIANLVPVRSRDLRAVGRPIGSSRDRRPPTIRRSRRAGWRSRPARPCW